MQWIASLHWGILCHIVDHSCLNQFQKKSYQNCVYGFKHTPVGIIFLWFYHPMIEVTIPNRSSVKVQKQLIYPGSAFPLGATWNGEGVNFALYAQEATKIELCLFETLEDTT